MMDGQGKVKDETIQNVLFLTNFALINVHIQELTNEPFLNDLWYIVDLIKECDDNVHIMLIIRDAVSSSIIKENPQEKISQKYNSLSKLEDMIDTCVQLSSLKDLSK